MSKRSRRKRKRLSRRAQRRQSTPGWLGRATALAEFDNVTLTTGQALNLPKLSACIVELVEPELEETDDPEKIEGIIMTAVCAWDIAVAPEECREEMLNEVLRGAFRDDDPFERAEFRLCLEELIARKHSLFPDDRRFIVRHEVDFDGECPHVTVLSVLPAKETGLQAPPAS